MALHIALAYPSKVINEYLRIAAREIWFSISVQPDESEQNNFEYLKLSKNLFLKEASTSTMIHWLNYFSFHGCAIDKVTHYTLSTLFAKGNNNNNNSRNF